MRGRAAAWLLVAATGCATRLAPTEVPAGDVRARLAAAEASIRAGCFDCLAAALDEFDAIGRLRHLAPEAADAAAAGTTRAAALLDLRMRELGMADDGYLQRARDALTAHRPTDTATALTLEAIEAVPFRFPRAGSGTDASDLDARRRQRALPDKVPAMAEERRLAADSDPLAAYVWLSLVCTYGIRPGGPAAPWNDSALLAGLPSLRETTLVAYRVAVCVGSHPAALDQLLVREPRLLELNYHQGMAALARGRVDEAEPPLTRAYQWRPRWPAVTNALANVYLAWEEFDRALALFDATLSVVRDSPEARLGRVKALSYLGRHSDAHDALDALLADGSRVFAGEVHFWRAWNHARAGSVERAWTAINDAHRLWVNSEVLKLGGILAYQRGDLREAQKRLQEARGLNAVDCEVPFNLGNIHAELREWAPGQTMFAVAIACFEGARDELAKEIAAISESAADVGRKTRQIARREGQIATANRLITQSWFNSAVGAFNLGKYQDAQSYAERVIALSTPSTPSTLVDRARELLGRLKK
jgi:tetratricopeptide (TPR) repeat protein